MGLYYHTLPLRQRIKRSPYHKYIPYLHYWHYFDRPKAIRLQDLRAIYVPIPKVACRSIKFTLAQHLGLDDNPHVANWDYIGRAAVGRHTGYFRFAIVRNPLDRLLSCYAQKIVQFRQEALRDRPLVFWKYGDRFHRDMTFADFIETVAQIPDAVSDPHFRSQHHFVYHRGARIVDVVGTFESLEADWEAIAAHTQLPLLPQQNRSRHRPFEEVYTPGLARLAYARYEEDVQRFGYTDAVLSML